MTQYNLEYTFNSNKINDDHNCITGIHLNPNYWTYNGGKSLNAPNA